MYDFEVKLSEPISYQKEGQNLKSDTIRLISPNYKHRKHCTELKSAYYKAIDKFSQRTKDQKLDTNKKEKDDDKVTAEVIVQMMFVNCDDLDTVFESFNKMIFAGAGKIDDVTLTSFHLEQVSMDDYENMFGEYMLNFLAKF